MAIKLYPVRGKARWCRVLGKAPPGYDNGPAQWTLDVVLDEEGKKQFLASGADKFYVKVDKNTGEEYVKFTRNAIRKDGTEAKPIQVVGPDGKDWDQTKLIGNDSIVNVRFSLNEVTSQGKKRRKPSIIALQVWEHQKYEGKSLFETKETPTEDWSEE